MTFAYRAAEPSDHAFIIDSWISSYRTSPYAGMVWMDDWHSLMWSQIERVLGWPETTTHVVYTPNGGAADLHGFICADLTESPYWRSREPKRGRDELAKFWARTPLIHYVFVKGTYRGWKLAAGLFKSIGVDPKELFRYSCRTSDVQQIAAAGKIHPTAKHDALSIRFAHTKPRRQTA